MKLNATIDLTHEELMAAITASIRDAYRYGRWLPPGEAVEMCKSGTGFRVTWGDAEKPNDPDKEWDRIIAAKPPTEEPAVMAATD
jgi:hypothetical protein